MIDKQYDTSFQKPISYEICPFTQQFSHYAETKFRIKKYQILLLKYRFAIEKYKAGAKPIALHLLCISIFFFKQPT